MATWKADLFVNSKVGRIKTEVEAATFSGAKEQIYAKHDNVQQITNLRQVNSNSGGSSFNSDDVDGKMWLVGIGIVLYLLVTYWYIAVPLIIIGGVLYYYGSRED
jgi:hypothetical protein